MLTSYSIANLPALSRRYGLTSDVVSEIRTVAQVFPFRLNSFVADELIDWRAGAADPLFRLVVPHREMLTAEEFQTVERAMNEGSHALAGTVDRIRRDHNPYPSKQLENVPTIDGSPVEGLQHKYSDTVLAFPSQGQTCHAFCTYCFRWSQFVRDVRAFDLRDPEVLSSYVARHPEVSDVIITGGDALVMRTGVLRTYVEPLLAIAHVRTIRFATKAPIYMPQRLLDESDSLDELVESIRRHGKSCVVMLHATHPRELENAVVRSAIDRIQRAGATIRCQAPIAKGINDRAETLRALWAEETRLGCVPYYAFVPRDTGADASFSVPIARALDVYREAVAGLSGLARSALGPVMSTDDGKIVVDGVLDFNGTRCFAMRYHRARKTELVGTPLLARYDTASTWFSDLVPFSVDAESTR